MSSVRNRIQQFQKNDSVSCTSSSGSAHVPEFSTNGSTNKPIGITSANKPTSFTSTTTKSSVSAEPSSTRNSVEREQVVNMSKITSVPKKTTLTINLSSSSTGGKGGDVGIHQKKPTPSPNRPIGLGRPRTPSSSIVSSIPKLISPTTSGSVGAKAAIGVTTINGIPQQSTTEKLYGSMNWKEKYDESERKRLHIVSLAQKATRDYEELRRRYQELCSENEKVVQKFNNSTSQLESLRKVSEAAYDDYHKLKKHYHVENNAKSQALSRVDEYNKENRRLKRQSAALMQHVTDGGNFDLEQLIEGAGGESPEHDKEINFLRSRVQELESRLVNLESELERTKLAEFESQEATMLINDSVQASINETKSLQEHIKKSEADKENLNSIVSELRNELDSLKSKEILEAEKLHMLEVELRKIQTEKNVLQRQSVIFFSNATLDAQLHDAMNQISELQFQFEEQKLNYERHILELQEQIHETESAHEAKTIEMEAKVKSFETLVEELRKRAEDAEKKLEEIPETVSCILPPPPPPPPMMMSPPPPPPPPPPNLNSSIQSVTLRRRIKKEESDTRSPSPPNGSCAPSLQDSKSIIPTSSAQIDDVVSQIKKGIKLRSAESRTMSRKETDVGENKPSESIAIEEMRSILNNLKRTRRD